MKDRVWPLWILLTTLVANSPSRRPIIYHAANKVVKVAIVALCAHSASSDKPSIASGAVVLEEKDVGTDASKAVSRKASETPASGTLTDNGDSTGNGTEERGLLHLLLKKGSGYGHG